MTFTRNINIKYAVKARTRLENIAQLAQNGGVASTIIYALLKEKIVDKALAAARNFNEPQVISLKNSIDITKIPGSRYFYVPVLQALNIPEDKSKNICIVGLPCHIRAATNIEKIIGVKFLKIGLLCFKNFYLSTIRNILKSMNIDLKNVRKMEIVKKSMKIYVNSSIVSIKLSKLKSSTKCLYCKCFIPFEADLVLGNVGSPPTETTVLVFTDNGFNALKASEKYLKIDYDINIDTVLKMQKLKEKISLKKKI